MAPFISAILVPLGFVERIDEVANGVHDSPLPPCSLRISEKLVIKLVRWHGCNSSESAAKSARRVKVRQAQAQQMSDAGSRLAISVSTRARVWSPNV